MKMNKSLIVAIFCCLIGICAMAQKPKQEEPKSSAAGISVVVIMVVAVGLGLRVISKNLRRVEKDLEDTFGEKVLP